MVRSLLKITSDVQVKDKGKGHPVKCQWGGGRSRVKWRFLIGVGGQCDSPAALPPRKDNQYPLCRRLVKPQDRSGRMPKISSLLELGPRTVQSTATTLIRPSLTLWQKAYCLPERQTSNCKHWILHTAYL